MERRVAGRYEQRGAEAEQQGQKEGKIHGGPGAQGTQAQEFEAADANRLHGGYQPVVDPGDQGHRPTAHPWHPIRAAHQEAAQEDGGEPPLR